MVRSIFILDRIFNESYPEAEQLNADLNERFKNYTPSFQLIFNPNYAIDLLLHNPGSTQDLRITTIIFWIPTLYHCYD